MAPFASSGSGGSHKTVIEEGELSATDILIGGPEGTANGGRHC